MSIKKIDKNELRGYEGKEGLILQGCGGNPQEWVDGINDLFTKEGILLDGTKFGDDNCAVFENNGLTCLLYEFNDDTKVDIGKLAMWRIGTHSDLGGTWLSDYVENKLGGFSLTGTKKPDCPLIGQNGNIFNLMGIAAKTLRQNGMAEQSKEFLFNAGQINPKEYMDALQVEPSEFELIKYPERGTCLYRCGNERYLLQVIAPEYKAAIFGKAGGR